METGGRYVRSCSEDRKVNVKRMNKNEKRNRWRGCYKNNNKYQRDRINRSLKIKNVVNRGIVVVYKGERQHK